MFTYWMGVATLTGIYLIAILGISILTGFTGLFSLGHAGFMAIGGYCCALAIKLLGIPFYPALLVGIAASVAVGLLIGWPTLKLKGDYFVIATLGIGEVVKLIIENLPQITGGARGLTDIPRESSFWLVWGIVVIVVILLRNFLTAKQGRNCIAVREEELAARSIGIDVTYQKMVAMGISCGLCGLSGGLLAGYMGYLYPIMFNMAKSNELILTVILGGSGSLTGTIIAALVLVPLPEFLRIEAAQEWRMVVYGLLVVLVIVLRPSGLMGNREFSIKGFLNFFRNGVQKQRARMAKGGESRD